MAKVLSYGGSGFRGVELVCVCMGKGMGMGHKREQLLSLRNSPSLSEVSLDWRITGSLHGRGRNRRLSLV